MSNYPNSIDELDLDAVQLQPAVVEAVKRLAKSRPWRGTLEERKQKFAIAIDEICVAAGSSPPHVVFHIDEQKSSGGSCFIPAANTIILTGRFSVISGLHEVCHFLNGRSEHLACAWSLALFRHCFPRSWARLTFSRHMAVAGPTITSSERRRTP